MKKIILIAITILVSCNKKKDTPEVLNYKETIIDICKTVSSASFVMSETSDFNLIQIENYVKDELKDYDQNKKELIKNHLIADCKKYRNYTKAINKRIDILKGNKDRYEIWDKFIDKVNEAPWELSEKQKFLTLCFEGLYEKSNYRFLCNCTINKISEHIKASYFYNLSDEEQAYLAGQVSRVFCFEK